MAACEAQIERQGAVMRPRCERDEPLGPWPRVQPGSPSKHPSRYEAGTQLARFTGVDRVAVTGISASIAQTRISSPPSRTAAHG